MGKTFLPMYVLWDGVGGGDGLLNCQLFDHLGNPKWAEEETCHKSQWFTTKHISDGLRGREWPFSLLEGDCLQLWLTKLNFNWTMLLFYVSFNIVVFFMSCHTCEQQQQYWPTHYLTTTAVKHQWKEITSNWKVICGNIQRNGNCESSDQY